MAMYTKAPDSLILVLQRDLFNYYSNISDWERSYSTFSWSYTIQEHVQGPEQQGNTEIYW